MHVAMIYRGPNDGEGIIVYHDGVDMGNDTTKTSYSYIPPSGVIKIGRLFDEPGTPRYGSAHVDELLFFNYQLSQPEVTMIKDTAGG